MRAPTPDHVILGILAVTPQHGYDLLERFRSQAELGRIWTMSTSQLYAVLKRLEKQGLISGRQMHSEDAPPRTEYTVTEAGHGNLQAWLNDPAPSASIRRVRVEFISRLYVAAQLNIDTTAMIAAQRQALGRQHDHARGLRAASGSPTEQLALDFMIGQIEAALAWLDTCQGYPHDLADSLTRKEST